ncbi:hypothetical protein ACXPWS_21875 [Mycobacterium sp. BMJ-28]
MKLAHYTRHGKWAAARTSTGPSWRALPADSLCGPYGFDHDSTLALEYGEFVYFYPVAQSLTHHATIEVTGAQNGDTTTFGPFDVDNFPGHGASDLTGHAFGLAPGTYAGIIYRPNDLETAHRHPTSDAITVVTTDAKGVTRTSARLSLTVPPVNTPAVTTWGPRSADPVDIGRLDAFTGTTFLPTGEVVFDVEALDFENDDVTVTVGQPAYGTVVAVRTDRATVLGGPLGASTAQLIQYVYTPYEQHRTDTSVYHDSFTFSVDDGNGGVTVAAVPVVIPKLATTIPAGPHLGDDSFTGQITAPLHDIAGYLVVPTSLLAQSIASLADSQWCAADLECGAVTVDEHGVFVYTRHAQDGEVPADATDDSFAVIAYTERNEWAAAMVPVGASALTSYPSIVDILTSVPTSPRAV